MIKIIGTRRYNSETAKAIAEKDHYNSGNNYSGTTRLMVSPQGNLFWWTTTNGQDLYLQDNIWLPEAGEEIDLTGFEILDENLASEHNLIEDA